MENTLKLFTTLTTPEFESMDLEHLAVAYTKDLNPSVLATAFCKLYKLIISTSSSYFGMTDEDIASFSIEELDKCLQVYDPSKGAFSTIYTIYLKNRFRMETQQLNTYKRKANLYNDSYEGMLEVVGIDIEAKPYVDDEAEILQVLDDFKSLHLTKRELEYCKLVMQGFKNKEIAEQFNVSVMTLSNLRKRIRQKVSYEALYCY